MKDNVVQMAGAVVLLRGTLKGMDRETACEILARRQPIPGPSSDGSRRYEYTQCSVLYAPYELPDGDYTITTEDGHSLQATRLHGMWLVGGVRRPAEVQSLETA